MNELEQFFYNADHRSDKWQPYFNVYDRHISQYRNRPITLVEVGVQGGGSLDMWAQYLHKDSTIIGIDIDPECAKHVYKYPNVQVVIGDQGNPAFWDEFLKNKSIDVFVDDGGHFMHQQIISFEKVWHNLNMGGTFICEDTHTSYWAITGGALNHKDSFIEYSKNYIDVLHYDWKEHTNHILENNKELVKDTLTSVHFYDSIVVLEKFGKANMHRVVAEGKL
jgi:hypothetical protein